MSSVVIIARRGQRSSVTKAYNDILNIPSYDYVKKCSILAKVNRLKGELANSNATILEELVATNKT